MDLAPSIIAALAAAIVWYSLRKVRRYLFRLKVQRQHRCQPPPWALSNDPLLRLDSVYRLFWSFKDKGRNDSLKEQLEILGYTFQSKVFGKLEVFSAEPRNIQAIFATDFESYEVHPLRYFAFQPLIGKGIMTMDGAHWAHSRALLQPLFLKPQSKDLVAFETHMARLINLIPRDGSTVDLQPLFARLALDTSSEMLFGESFALLSACPGENAVKFWQDYSYAQSQLGKRLQLPNWNIFTRDSQFWKSCSTVRELVRHYLNKPCAELDQKSGKVVLENEVQNAGCSIDEAIEQLLNLFLPAHDAIAVVLTNVFFCLARHPDSWLKLQREIVDLGVDDVNLKRLRSLEYLQFVIKETLRLYPTIGSVGRVALRDTILPVGGGKEGLYPILIEKGTGLRTSFYALHRRKDVYGENPQEFSPDRWATLHPPRWAYLPFGGGPRTCPGQQLALAQVSYAVVRILRTFRGIENRDPVVEFIERYKITTESQNGAKVSLIPA